MGKQVEPLVVGSRVKDMVREAGCQSAGDLLDALSEKVAELINAAIKRAKENGRATVRPYDL